MGLKYDRKLILAAVEGTAGTAEALDRTNAVLATNIELTPLAGDSVSREIEYPYYGNSAQIPVNKHIMLTFRVELQSSGAAGTAPGWGNLLQGCGMAETIARNSKVDYTPISDKEKTITISINISNQAHVLAGARGTFTIEVAANQIPYLSFTFTGLWTDPVSAVAVANPDFSRFKVPLIGSNTNTPTFNFFGKATLGLSSFSYDHANEVFHRELIGAKPEVIISGRAPTGQVVIDAPTYTKLNLVEKAATAATSAMALTHGKDAGKIVEFNAPKVSLSAPSYSDDNGIMQLTAPLQFIPNTGNDEIKITAK